MTAATNNYTIKIFNRISDKGLDLFDRDRYAIVDSAEAPDAYMLRSQKLHGETLPASLLAMARAGAGVNNIPV